MAGWVERLFNKDHMSCKKEMSFKFFFCLANQIINIILNPLLKYFGHKNVICSIYFHKNVNLKNI